MGRTVPYDLCIVGMVFIAFILAGQGYAGEPDDKKPKALLDCRYGQTYEQIDNGAAGEAFPSDDVFRPLLADPKQPQFFAMWQSTQSRTNNTSANIGSVGIGENFGFYTSRQGCNGWQVSLLAGIFSQFNLDEKNAELINTDFVVGVPLTWRVGNWSTRLRWLHQSSHLGDEFLKDHPGTNNLGLTYEEVEAILSYEYKWARMYAGAAYLVHREPATIDRSRVQWGFEVRAPSMRSRILGGFLDRLILTPLLTADFKSFEETNWIINTNVLGGLEWSRTGSLRRFRIMVNYYHGFNPYGQFFIQQKVESVGIGAYFMF